MKTWALLLGAVYMLATVATTLLAWVISGLVENRSSEDTDFIWLAGLASVFAVIAFAAIVIWRWRLAFGAFLLNAVVAGIVCERALEVSDHSDGKVILFVAAVELCGAGAVLLDKRAYERG